jgi:hypothetical protein
MPTSRLHTAYSCPHFTSIWRIARHRRWRRLLIRKATRCNLPSFPPISAAGCRLECSTLTRHHLLPAEGNSNRIQVYPWTARVQKRSGDERIVLQAFGRTATAGGRCSSVSLGRIPATATKYRLIRGNWCGFPLWLAEISGQMQGAVFTFYCLRKRKILYSIETNLIHLLDTLYSKFIPINCLLSDQRQDIHRSSSLNHLPSSRFFFRPFMISTPRQISRTGK